MALEGAAAGFAALAGTMISTGTSVAMANQQARRQKKMAEAQEEARRRQEGQLAEKEEQSKALQERDKARVQSKGKALMGQGKQSTLLTGPIGIPDSEDQGKTLLGV